MPILMVVNRVLPLSRPPLVVVSMMTILIVIGTFSLFLKKKKNMFLVTHMVIRTSITIHTRMVIHMVLMKTCMVYICTLWECG